MADGLLAAGHRVADLARSDGSVRKLEERGVQAARGEMADAKSVRESARGADAVVHATLGRGEGAEEADRTVVGAVLKELRGTGRPFCVQQRGVGGGGKPGYGRRYT